MSSSINILMAQINPKIGNIAANCSKIIDIIQNNKHSHDLIIFPELALTGYLLEDLLFRDEIFTNINKALEEIRDTCDNNCHVIIGHPQKINNQCFNQASVFAHNICKINYSKQKLPNYGVFDENRYFVASNNEFPIFTINEWKIKLCICEDLWQSEPSDIFFNRLLSKFDILVTINASPFEIDKHKQRLNLCEKFAREGVNLIYVNQVGGQDEIIFDGASFALDFNGKLIAQSSQFIEEIQTLTINKNFSKGQITPVLNDITGIYKAIVLGLKDYVHKNNFKKVLLGLSGGIDSALCLAIAVDALGPDNVTAVLLPSQYTADISNEDALLMANSLNVKTFKFAINDNYEYLLHSVQQLTPSPNDLTKQNLQARIRGILLMAISNNTNAMLLCTSNKSETAVGYSTIYGDMIGGYAPIKDLFKTMVYELANYRNKISAIIPERIITRAPSAELAPDQKDEDNLPKYEILDPILKLYIEENLTAEQIEQKGYAPEIISKIIKLINYSEYKRKQAPLGPKISNRAFGKDWRIPLSKN